MKKILFSALVAAAFLSSCSQSNKNEYVIYGTVSDPKLEGAQVFLVPIDNPVKEEIDSVYIKDQVFEFRRTPQNDSLQVWKNLTTKHYQQLPRTPKENVDALKAAYVARTRQIASNVGENSTLGKFLNSRFPADTK